MHEVKTKPREEDVRAYILTLEPLRRREEGLKLLEMFEQETGLPAVLWGESMIGFGTYAYKYKSGHEGEWMRIGFAPGKAKISLYCYLDEGEREELLGRLGKHFTGVGCIYVNKLADIDEAVLRELIQKSMAAMDRLYPR